MKRVVVESPYAGDIERNTTYARRAVFDSLSRIEAPIASHLLYTQPGVLDENNPRERDWGIAAGQVWMPVANLVAFYTDYGMSTGMLLAETMANRLGVGCEYRTIGENP